MTTVGKTLSVMAAMLGLVGVAHAQDCPTEDVAGLEEVQCKLEINASRCGQKLLPPACRAHNNRSFADGLITRDAWLWLNNWSDGSMYAEVEPRGCAVNADGLLIGICPPGCFEASTRILAYDEKGAAREVAASSVDRGWRIAALAAESSLEEPELVPLVVKSAVSGPEETDLIEFALSSGRRLRVTTHHGMVLSSGRVVDAQEVVVGDTFVSPEGIEVEVAAIAPYRSDANVHNFSTGSDHPQNHVIVAEGVLVGDLAWQNELKREGASIRARR